MPERILRVMREENGARSVLAEVNIDPAEAVFIDGESREERNPLAESEGPSFLDVVVVQGPAPAAAPVVETMTLPAEAPPEEAPPAEAVVAPVEAESGSAPAPKPRRPRKAAARKKSARKASTRKSPARKKASARKSSAHRM